MSPEFVIEPCPLGDFCTIAIDATTKSEFKSLARSAAGNFLTGCHLAHWISYGPQLIAEYRLADAEFPAVGISAQIGLAAVVIGTTALAEVAGGPPGKAVEFIPSLFDIACEAAQSRFQQTADDPSDPSYTRLEAPSFLNLPQIGYTVGDLAVDSLDRTQAYSGALVTAFERYQGAFDADDTIYVHLQALAASDNALALERTLRETAGRLRDYGAALAADTNLQRPPVSQDALDVFIAFQNRLATDGFSAAELSDLRAAGLTDSQISTVRADFLRDASDTPLGVSMQSELNGMADALDAYVAVADKIGRAMGAIAGRSNRPPEASFTAIPASGPPPLSVSFTDTSSSPDLDPIISTTWGFGDGATGSGPSVTHTYVVPGDYVVTLTVSDDVASATATRVISVSSTASTTTQPPPTTTTSTILPSTTSTSSTTTTTTIQFVGVELFVGYADNLRPDPNFPVPWQRSPNTLFIGNDGPYDAGAIRLDNTTGSPITVDSVVVTLPGAARGSFENTQFNLWGSFTIPAGQAAILTQVNDFDFDTSDFPITCTPLGPGTEPTVTVTIAAQPTTFTDTGRVLDTGGIDPASCTGGNESRQWVKIGSASGPATLTLAPPTQTRFLADLVTVTTTLLDASSSAIANVTVDFEVLSGPNMRLIGSDVTDSAGHARFIYTSGAAGTDTIRASVTNASGGAFFSEADVDVVWQVRSTTTTITSSTTSSLPSTTSTTSSTTTSQPTTTTSSPTTSTTSSSTTVTTSSTTSTMTTVSSTTTTFSTPSTSVTSTSTSSTTTTTIPLNHPPTCAGAVAIPAEIWPPNHQMVGVTIRGVNDLDGDAVTITITGITQDEELNGNGDGDSCPDATGVGTGTPRVRAERSGEGDGRVYHIDFTAGDGGGGHCSGTVRACVPHDRRPGHACVDQGSLVDSTGACDR